MKDYRVPPSLFLAEVPDLITGRPRPKKVRAQSFESISAAVRLCVLPGAVAFISLDLNFLICSVKLSS